MTRRNRLVIRESVWICGADITQALRHAISDVKILRERDAKIFLLKNHEDQNELEELRKLLNKDVHVILSWLHPKQLAAIKPLLKERKNFSVVADDWWILPYWFMREADYILFRKYHGVAVRLGKLPFVGESQPPWLLDPRPQASKYAMICTLLRPAALAISPIVEAINWWNRHDEEMTPEKCLYLPFGINCAADMPVKDEPLLYDFANTAGTIGIWLMRDPYVPFRYTFANLYHDRKHITDSIAEFDGKPFKFYDCRREKDYFLPYDVYLQKCRQTRYVICTGGLHDAALPKYLEYACMGTPIIGRAVPYEHPWQDDCLFSLDTLRPMRKDLKSMLQEALDVYPKLREKCLNWRERLLKLYDFHNILDMAQDQADGKPIPSSYLKVESPAGAAKTH
jgi:hypothetical protein